MVIILFLLCFIELCLLFLYGIKQLIILEVWLDRTEDYYDDKLNVYNEAKNDIEKVLF